MAQGHWSGDPLHWGDHLPTVHSPKRPAREVLEELGYRYEGLLDQYVLPHPDAPGWSGVHWAVADAEAIDRMQPEDRELVLIRYAKHAAQCAQYEGMIKERGRRESRSD